MPNTQHNNDQHHRDFGCDCETCRTWRQGIYNSGKWPRPRDYYGERRASHEHHWLPLIRMDADGTAPCGSLGSQIGFSCACGASEVFWPEMAARTPGLTEDAVLAENSRRSARRSDGSSFFDQPVHGWPRRRVIQSCTAARGPLLTRYYLLDTRWVAVYLHHLHTSDDDRALHDHPWSFITVLLSSGYYEWTYSVQRLGLRRTWRRRFSVLFRPAEWAHRLELVRPTWTLVVRFRRRREWGFFTPGGWLDWRAYGKDWCD